MNITEEAKEFMEGINTSRTLRWSNDLGKMINVPIDDPITDKLKTTPDAGLAKLPVWKIKLSKLYKLFK